MSWDWQQFVALILVAAAILVVLRRARRLWKGAEDAGCGSGCSSCAVNQGAPVRPLVNLDLSSPADRNTTPSE
jgi:predicted RNA methylase